MGLTRSRPVSAMTTRSSLSSATRALPGFSPLGSSEKNTRTQRPVDVQDPNVRSGSTYWCGPSHTTDTASPYRAAMSSATVCSSGPPITCTSNP